MLYKMAISILEQDYLSLIGGPPHADILLSLLYKLSRDTETIVREKAVSVTVNVLERLDVGSVSADTLIELESAEDFQTKLSLCDLLPCFIKLVDNDSQRRLINVFTSLVKDPVPMVRARAAMSLESIFNSIPTHYRGSYFDQFLEIAVSLMDDPDENVKLSAIQLCLIPLLTYNDYNHYDELLPRILEFCNMKGSWRIKQAIVSQYDMILKAPVADHKTLLKIYFEMFADPECEVRKTAILKSNAICSICGQIAMKTFFEQYEEILKDPDPEVRCIAISQAEYFIKLYITENHSLLSDLKVKLQVLLDDPDQQVRNKVVHVLMNTLIARLPDFERLELLKEIYTLHMEETTPWRVLETVVVAIPTSAKTLMNFWETEANGMIFFEHALFHKVSSIRVAACNVISDLHAIFGTYWISSNVEPLISKLLASVDRYHLRISGLHAISHLIRIKDINVDFVKSSTFRLLNDRVPNVRIRAIYNLNVMFDEYKSSDVRRDIFETLKTNLIGEQDVDVIRCKQNVLQCVSAGF